ncbi:MAG: dihydrouridine synthase [Firmicutes bacterium HGW-Firmicutes-1]|nr:MAG: dihydrouridine synthase [Firmicutes bacterium HGW-Firmicutes-1]
MNLFLAPIQGMTISCYRNAFAKIFGGIDAYYAPFITTTEKKKSSHLLFKDLLPERNDAAIKIVPQLLSNNGADFRLFASALVDMGYNEINWNIGCPFPMVTNKKKGSGILPYSDMLKEFLDIACADSNYTITAKMRLGLHDPEEGIRVIKLLNEYPLSGVIIHARTGVQMYTGNVDLDSFEVLNTACKHEVTYNGDIFTYDDFMRIQLSFPSIKSFMLGRGALRDPFLPSMIKGQIIPPADKISMVKDFHDEIYTHYKNILHGDKHLCDKMNEFWTYMSVHTDKDGKLMKNLRKCHTSADYLDTISHVWSDSPMVSGKSPKNEDKV